MDIPTTSWSARPWFTPAASLIPWAAFLLATAVADIWVDFRSVSLGGVVSGSPFTLVIVAGPSLLPLTAAAAGWMRYVVLVMMTAVAAVAGVLVVATDDAQAGLAVLWVPYVALPLAIVIFVGRSVSSARSTRPAPGGRGEAASALFRDRLAALVVDVVIAGGALVAPLTALSHAEREVAAGVVGIVAGTLYLAVPVTVWGRSVGQSLLRLWVVDAGTGRHIPLWRALVRSAAVVLEVTATLTLIPAIPAVAELVAVTRGGRSLVDRLCRTVVTREQSSIVGWDARCVVPDGRAGP